ncbi:MAG: hypothetical protein WC714_29105 [Candidatus Obscuribacterales bacterium]|jgi:hypothetical protein
MNWIKGGLSYADGTMDDGAIAALATVAAYIAISAYSVYASASHVFNMQEFGIGAGALFAGVGVLLGQRKVN